MQSRIFNEFSPQKTSPFFVPCFTRAFFSLAIFGCRGGGGFVAEGGGIQRAQNAKRFPLFCFRAEVLFYRFFSPSYLNCTPRPRLRTPRNAVWEGEIPTGTSDEEADEEPLTCEDAQAPSRHPHMPLKIPSTGIPNSCMTTIRGGGNFDRSEKNHFFHRLLGPIWSTKSLKFLDLNFHG